MPKEQSTQDVQITSNPVLLNAWNRFAEYDISASKQQKNFLRLRITILFLGIAATATALVYTVSKPDDIANAGWGFQIFRYIVILLPISTSVLLAGAVKFDAGTKWILLRNSAEAIKKEIYRYRAKAEIYREASSSETGETRNIKLARKIKNITNRVMKTQVNQSDITLMNISPEKIPSEFAYVKGDDCFSDLSPDDYINYRLLDQSVFYKNRTGQLEKRLKQLQWSIYLLGGVGTFLAAIGLEIWIAISSAIAGALTTYLEMKRVEQTLISYNQAATDLQGIHTWWLSLSDKQKKTSINLDKLVKNTETVIQSEHLGWVQEMRDALDELYGSDEQDTLPNEPPKELE